MWKWLQNLLVPKKVKYLTPEALERLEEAHERAARLKKRKSEYAERKFDIKERYLDIEEAKLKAQEARWLYEADEYGMDSDAEIEDEEPPENKFINTALKAMMGGQENVAKHDRGSTTKLRLNRPKVTEDREGTIDLDKEFEREE